MKRRRYRHRVTKRNRYIDRVRPSAMAEAKKRPWPLQVLLQRGPEDGGIDVAEFEAAVQIVEAFDALTSMLGMASLDLGTPRISATYAPREMSDRAADLAATWFAWADRLPWRATDIVDAINGAASITSVPALRHALQLWALVADERRRARRAQRQPVAAE